MRPFARAVPLVLLLAAGGCASSTLSDEAIEIATTPAGARCEATRDGGLIGRVASTPAKLMITKGKTPIRVRCELAHHAPGEAEAAPYVASAGAMAINAFAFGLIGLAASAAAESANEDKYPSRIELVLYRGQFPSEAERDAYYAVRESEIVAQFDRKAVETRTQCEGRNNADLVCSELETVAREREAKLAELRRIKSTTVIAAE